MLRKGFEPFSLDYKTSILPNELAEHKLFGRLGLLPLPFYPVFLTACFQARLPVVFSSCAELWRRRRESNSLESARQAVALSKMRLRQNYGGPVGSRTPSVALQVQFLTRQQAHINVSFTASRALHSCFQCCFLSITITRGPEIVHSTFLHETKINS